MKISTIESLDPTKTVAPNPDTFSFSKTYSMLDYHFA
jgi:hypothetical protein